MTAQAESNAAVEVIRSYGDRDWDRGLQAITEDCEVVEVPTGETWKGRAGLRREFERWAAGFSDSHSEILTVVEQGEWVCLEAIWKGTHDGELVLPDVTLAPTGKELAFPYCTVAHVRDGKQTGSKHYYDLGTVLRQLGLG